MKLKKLSLSAAFVLTAAFTVNATASASMATFDAGTYTFSYDTSYWGVGDYALFLSQGNVFTFTNQGGIAATTTISRSTGTSFGLSESYGPGVLQITAKSGYQITGISTGSSGLYSTMVGTGGTLASGIGAARTIWSTSNGNVGPSQWGWSYDFSQLASEPSVSQKAYTTTDGGTSFAAGTTTATGNFDSYLEAYASGKGSSASVSQDMVSFSVNVAAVSAVPEPESYAMLLVGLGLMGAIVKRRRARQA